MLTRRVFRQLTDSILFDTKSVPKCFCTSHRPSATRSASHHNPHHAIARYASTSSSTRWKSRQNRDRFAREAKVQGLKSRAAFKLLEIDQKYKLFKPGQTVVDLGYAPGSWSQVAQTRTSPDGRVIGIDILPVQPPKGVSTIQGNFLSPHVQAEVRRYVQDPHLGRARERGGTASGLDAADGTLHDRHSIQDGRGYIDMERHADLDFTHEETIHTSPDSSRPERKLTLKERDTIADRVVDIILSDMCAPWDQTTGLWSKSISNVYRRMQNTSGIPFKDHAGSMDLCMAALTFAFDTLRTGGGFVCKFYQGSEDKVLERRLKKLFERVVREKPESSRSVSLESAPHFLPPLFSLGEQ
jgi:21S rRNA (uridine2791-2'-O)-methyltransferase